MSENPGRKVLQLSLRCLVFLIFFFALWFFATPLYNRILAGSLDILLPWLESPKLTDAVEARDGNLVVISPVVLDNPVHSFRGDFHFGTVIFAALLFASLPQLRVTRRLLLCGIGLLVLFVLHCLEIYFLNQTFYSVLGGWRIVGSFTDAQRNFFNYAAQVMKHGEMAFPLAIWVFIYFPLRRLET